MSGARHVKKFMDGKMSPDELHRAYGRPCYVCPQPGAIQIRTLMLMKDMVDKYPEVVAQVAALNPNGPFVPYIPTKMGPMVLVSDIWACDSHKRDAERAAAKAPSWAIVEINRGPGKDRPQVQVPNTN